MIMIHRIEKLIPPARMIGWSQARAIVDRFESYQLDEHAPELLSSLGIAEARCMRVAIVRQLTLFCSAIDSGDSILAREVGCLILGRHLEWRAAEEYMKYRVGRDIDEHLAVICDHLAEWFNALWVFADQGESGELRSLPEPEALRETGREESP